MRALLLVLPQTDVMARFRFDGKPLEEGLAWCLVWLMAPEIGDGPFLG